MDATKVPHPQSNAAFSSDEALQIANDIGYQVIVRTAYMLDGGGSGIAYTPNQLKDIVKRVLEWSFGRQVLVEQYLNN